MLFYTILLTLINALIFFICIPTLLGQFKNGNFGSIFTVIVITGSIILNIVIFVTIVLFFKFHLELVFSNQTTLETLELKRQGKDPEEETS